MSANAKMNVEEYRQLLLFNRPQLVGAISVEDGLHNYLISCGVLSFDQWLSIKEKPQRAQIEDILDILYKKQCPESFEKFCMALKKNNQGHVVRNYLNRSRLPFENETLVSRHEKPPPCLTGADEIPSRQRYAEMREVTQCLTKQTTTCTPNTIYAADARPERGPEVSARGRTYEGAQYPASYHGNRPPSEPEVVTGIHSFPSSADDHSTNTQSEVRTVEPLATRVEEVLRLGPTDPTGGTVLMDTDYYDINQEQPGHVHIVNIRNFKKTGTASTGERFGSETDVSKLYSLFAKKKFKVNVTSDVTANELMELVWYIANNQSLRFASSFILVLMSHGEEGSLITTDGKTIPFDEILDRFKGIACPALVGKPKMFIIQACRGRENNRGVIVKRGGPALSKQVVKDAFPRESIPDNADCLFAYSTTLGHWSYRNIEEGSWFITTLCKVFELEKEDVLHMLVEVNREVSSMGSSTEKQMPMPALTLRKKWYLTGKKL